MNILLICCALIFGQSFKKSLLKSVKEFNQLNVLKLWLDISLILVSTLSLNLMLLLQRNHMVHMLNFWMNASLVTNSHGHQKLTSLSQKVLIQQRQLQSLKLLSNTGLVMANGTLEDVSQVTSLFGSSIQTDGMPVVLNFSHLKQDISQKISKVSVPLEVMV